MNASKTAEIPVPFSWFIISLFNGNVMLFGGIRMFFTILTEFKNRGFGGRKVGDMLLKSVPYEA